MSDGMKRLVTAVEAVTITEPMVDAAMSILFHSSVSGGGRTPSTQRSVIRDMLRAALHMRLDDRTADEPLGQPDPEDA